MLENRKADAPVPPKSVRTENFGKTGILRQNALSLAMTAI
jgi:hypothetical protein